jgi:methylated-DNA-[protein]-cysteine S-methyltransferase
MSDRVALGFVEGTSVGCVGVAVTARGLASLTMRPSRRAAERELRERFGDGARIDAAVTAEARREVRDYLAGNSKRFSTRIDWSQAGTDFQRQVWKALQRVPYGRTVTYGELAAKAGRPGAARAVGNAMNANPWALAVP